MKPKPDCAGKPLRVLWFRDTFSCCPESLAPSYSVTSPKLLVVLLF